MSKKAVWKKYKKEVKKTGQPIVRLGTWYRLWTKEFPKVKVPKRSLCVPDCLYITEQLADS